MAKITPEQQAKADRFVDILMDVVNEDAYPEEGNEEDYDPIQVVAFNILDNADTRKDMEKITLPLPTDEEIAESLEIAELEPTPENIAEVRFYFPLWWVWEGERPELGDYPPA